MKKPGLCVALCLALAAFVPWSLQQRHATAAFAADATVTATATPGQMTWKVYAVSVAPKGTDAQNWDAAPSLKQVTIGQKVTLFVVGRFTGLTGVLDLVGGARVLLAGKTQYLDNWKDTVDIPDNNSDAVWSETFKPKTVGTYTFTGTLFVGKKHKHKAVTFTVVSR